MTFWQAVRYFHAVTPVRIYFRVAMGGTVLFAAVLAFEGSRSDAALVSLLVLQMFAVSTGFRAHATRGYYDPLLTRLPRFSLASAHAAYDAWKDVPIAERAEGNGQGPRDERDENERATR